MAGKDGRRGKAGNARLYRELGGLSRRERSPSMAKERERRAGLRATCRRLDALGYKGLTARGLGERHVRALVADWHARGLSPGRMKNLMSHLRWRARTVGKGSVVVRDNARHGIADRRAARGYADGLRLDPAKLASVRAEGGAGGRGVRSSRGRRSTWRIQRRRRWTCAPKGGGLADPLHLGGDDQCRVVVRSQRSGRSLGGRVFARRSWAGGR